jgi:hypothetical protein
MPHGGPRRGAGRPKQQKPRKSAISGAAARSDGAATKRPSKPNLNKSVIKSEIKLPKHGGPRSGAGRPARKSAAIETERPVTPEATMPLTTSGNDADMSRRVALCAGSGMDVPMIAAALLIEETKLRVEFAHELANGSAIVQAANLVALSMAAADGNAAAAKALLSIAMRTATPADAPPAAAPSDATSRALRILQGGRK